MNLLTQYLARTILHTLGIVLVALAGLEAFILLISQSSDIGNGSYNVFQALIYVVLILPVKLYAFFPMAGLVGVLLGLGVLANHNELIVMRAAGVSLRQITITLLKIALVLILLVTLIGETIAPYLQSQAEKRKTDAISSGQTLNTGQGTWVRDGNAFFHIRLIKDARQLESVSRYLFDTRHRLKMVSYARRAYYQKKQWIFEDIVQTSITGQGTHSEHIDRAALTLSLQPKLLKMAMLEPTSMSIVQLFQTMRYHAVNGLHVASYSLAFWQRLCQPVASLIMMLLAIPFIFGPLRFSNIGLRLLAGISLSFSFYILNEFFGPVSVVMQLPPFWAAILPSIVFALSGIALMRRAR